MNLRDYILEFNLNDEECYRNDIDNAHAYEWLAEEIPVLECPDKVIEKTYYFRWWVYRKHIKTTPEGYIITEFLPNVPWSGKYNAINAASCHHIMEGRWLKNAKRYLTDYIYFFLNNPCEGMRYSSWLIDAAKCFNNVKACLNIPDFLKKAVSHFNMWDKERKTECGLYWSVDDRDAMEYSISGTSDGKATKGVRPTLNSYMYADAAAIYDLSVQCGHPKEEFKEKAEEIKSKINSLLWRDGFYKALHPKNESFASLDKIETDHVPRELIGYIPWCFSVSESGRENVFDLLEDKTVFKTDFGITTAEQSHPSFLFRSDHECMWNGYIWPFATSQVLTGLINTADNTGDKKYTDIFFTLLKQYADMHTRTDENGKKLMWIDEVMAPYSDIWTGREILKNQGWQKEKGGYERGKDYNHSTFCDLVISGLGGVRVKNGEVEFHPRIPENWEYFLVDNLCILGDNYKITYDKSGAKYGHVGWKAYKNGAEYGNLKVFK